MTPERLAELLDRFDGKHIAVVGDFCLDRYLYIDPQLTELSLETGREAHQVVGMRCSPGAGGTVVNNLRALGISVAVVSVVDDDCHGHELRALLDAEGSSVSGMITTVGRPTPVYLKPMFQLAEGGWIEGSRLDILPRSPLDPQSERQVIDQLQRVVGDVAGVVIADQIESPECGVITSTVREAIADLAGEHPHVKILADSRARIGQFCGVMLKPNAREACMAVNPEARSFPPAMAEWAGRELAQRTGHPVFVTLGAEGIAVCDTCFVTEIPAVTPIGQIDIVGAGDSVSAGIIGALASGADPTEAAEIGMLMAGVTVRKIGTTGTASQAELRALHHETAEG